jgi:hypothetical protein
MSNRDLEEEELMGTCGPKDSPGMLISVFAHNLMLDQVQG